jgi:hypothetical protein
MPREIAQVVIDARPSGPRGLLAHELVLGRSVLSHLLDQALTLSAMPVLVHARLEAHRRLQDLLGDGPADRVVFHTGPPPEGSAILRADRLYDTSRLRRALRRGSDPESAAIWRLDHPQGLFGAGDELIRRQSYQPLGRYWALAPARRLARALCPTQVRPNALTLVSGLLVLGASAAVAWRPWGLAERVAISTALALALVLDTADGHLARLQGTASEFGRWLDSALDELGDMALHAAIAWAAFARDAHPIWLLLGMLYGMGKYLFVCGNDAWEGNQAAGTGPVCRSAPAGAVTTVIRLAGHADVRWHLWIVLAFVGRLDLGLAAYSVYFPARAFAGAVRKAVGHA